jgi:hypothetical protein
VVIGFVQSAEGINGEVRSRQRVHVRAQTPLHHVEKRVAHWKSAAAAQHSMLQNVRYATAVPGLRGEAACKEVV